MTFAGIDDRAHGRKQVASPVGAKPVGDLPKDGTHADGLFAGVIRGGNGAILQKEEQVVLDLGIAFLQPAAVGVGGLERERAVDTPLQITPVLIEGGGREGITTLVNGKELIREEATEVAPDQKIAICNFTIRIQPK